jgi:hypothetical protein
MGKAWNFVLAVGALGSFVQALYGAYKLITDSPVVIPIISAIRDWSVIFIEKRAMSDDVCRFTRWAAEPQLGALATQTPMCLLTPEIVEIAGFIVLATVFLGILAIRLRRRRMAA